MLMSLRDGYSRRGVGEFGAGGRGGRAIRRVDIVKPRGLVLHSQGWRTLAQTITKLQTWRVQKARDEVRVLILCALWPLTDKILLLFPFSVEDGHHVLLFLFDVRQEHGQGCSRSRSMEGGATAKTIFKTAVAGRGYRRIGCLYFFSSSTSSISHELRALWSPLGQVFLFVILSVRAAFSTSRRIKCSNLHLCTPASVIHVMRFQGFERTDKM